ncbi:sigma-70 family RNA polymerase sigma factor [Carnobacteriaceae bacterium zg-ZUI78]|nr:sigma-70 family RNA polymerase sigma factor [Carnobacteriaceae bacterium zg-ZUI78]
MKDKKEYYLKVNGKRIPVTRKVYLEHCKELNRENYLKRLDRKNNLLYFSEFDKENDNFIDHIKDKSVDVEKIVEAKMRIEDLYRAISKLNEEERKIIDAIYFDEKSIRDLAKENKTNVMKISRKHKSILNKIRKWLAD